MSKANTLLRIVRRALNVFLCNLITCLMFTKLVDSPVSGAVVGFIAAAALITSLISEAGKAEPYLIAGYWIIVFFTAFYLAERIVNGARFIAGEMSGMVNNHFGTKFAVSLKGCTEFDRDLLLMFVMAAMCFLLTFAYKARKRYVFWAFLSLAPLYTALVLNVFQETKIILAYAGMIVFLCVTASWEWTQGARVLLYELLLISLLMIFGVTMTKVITPERHEYSTEHGKFRAKVRKFNENTVNRITEKLNEAWNGQKGKTTAGMAGGKLSSDGLSYTGKTHLVVTLPKNSPRTYLRGYVGGDYSFRRWFPPSEYHDTIYNYSVVNISYSNIETWEYFDTDDYRKSPFDTNGGAIQAARAEIVIKTYDMFNRLICGSYPELTPRFPLYRAGIQVERVEASPDYVYVPYCVSDGLGSAATLRTHTDSAWEPVGNGQSQRFYVIYNERGLPNYYTVSKSGTWNALPLYPGAERRQVAILSHFTHYIELQGQYYLEVPDSVSEALKPLIPSSAYRLQTIEEKVAFVQSFMENNFSYSIKPKQNKDDEDPLIFFITESKEGYCMHYASTAVFLFRLLDVPARYAEGYVISEDQIAGGKQSGLYSKLDSSEEDASSSTKTAKWDTNGFHNIDLDYVEVQVKDSSAHAWTEIWLPDYGWFPVEVTYGFDETPDLDGMRRQIDRETVTRAPTAGPTGSVKPTTTPSVTKTPTKKDTKKDKNKKDEESFNYYVLIPILLPVLFILFFIIRYNTICLRRNRRFLVKDANKATLSIYKEIIKLAGYLGIHREEKEMDREFHERLFRELPHFSDDISMENAAKLTELAAFSKEGITNSDKILVRRYYRRLRKECLMRKKNPGRILWQIYRGI